MSTSAAPPANERPPLASNKPSPALGLAAALLCLLTPHLARADGLDPYEEAFARATALERSGRLIEAARALESVAPLYPQDYALALQLAWTYFRAGIWAEAERHYRTALDLGQGAPDPRLGLALSLEKQGRCDEARGYLRPLAADPVAAEALSRCKETPALTGYASLSFTGQRYPDHPYKSFAAGGTASAGISHRSGLFLGATYRYGHFSPPSTSTSSAWDQHEGFVDLGYARKLFGLGFTYGVVSDGSGAFGTSKHFGLSGRVSPFGDIVVNASASLYADLTVLRVEPSWKIPLAHGLSVTPGAAIQRAGSETLATGLATLTLERPSFGLFVGGKYGDEVRPAYLDLPVVYDIGERAKYGVWAGGNVNVGGGFRIHLSYAMDRLEGAATSSTPSYLVNGHTLTLGTTASF